VRRFPQGKYFLKGEIKLKEIIDIIKKSGISIYLLLICLILSITSSFLAVLPAQFLGFVITALSGGGDAVLIGSLLKKIVYNTMLDNNYKLAIAGIVLFFIFSFIFTIFRNFYCYFVTIVSEKIIVLIKKKLFTKILKISFLQYLKKPKGQLIYTIINDTQRLEYIFSNPFYMLFSDLFDLVWISIFLLIVDPIILALLITIAPLVYIASIKTGKVQKKVAENIQKIDADLTTNLEQTLNGFETIKAFNGEKYEEHNFFNKVNESFQNRIKAAKSLSFFYPLEGMLRVAGISIVVLYAIYKVNYGLIQIGMIAVLIDYSNRFYHPIRNIAQYYQTIQAGIVSAKRISDFFDMQEEQDLPREIVDHKEYLKDKIVFDNVSLTINDNKIIENFSFFCCTGDIVYNVPMD